MEDQRAQMGACTSPPSLDDLALIAAADGEAGDDILAHLHDCPYCAERARDFADLQAFLRRRLYRVLCPASDELAAYQQGWLEAPRRDLIRDHLRDCLYCAGELRLLAEATRVPVVAPPGRRLRRIVAELLAPRMGGRLA